VETVYVADINATAKAKITFFIVFKFNVTKLQ